MAVPNVQLELEPGYGLTAVELRAWLGPLDSAAAAIEHFARSGAQLSLSARLGLAFIIIVLRDVYSDDVSVRHWLHCKRPELNRSVLDALGQGETAACEALAVREWNLPTRTAEARPRRSRTLRAMLCSALVMVSSLFGSASTAQSPDVVSRMAEVLHYAGVRTTASDAQLIAGLWTNAQKPGLSGDERWLAFRELMVAYARLQGRDVTARPEVLDGNARFAASIYEGGGRFDLNLPAPRGNPDGRYLHVETSGHGPQRLLLIADAGIDGRHLYGPFIERNAESYTADIVTLPFAGAARPLPWPETMDYSARPWLGQIERELLALVEAPAMRSVTVVGTAAGGYFAARLALRRPERVRAAVLVNAQARMELPSPIDPKRPASMEERLTFVRSMPPAPQLWPVAPIPARDEIRRLVTEPASRHPSVQNWMAFAVRDTALSRSWTVEALAGGFFLPSNRYRWELTTTDLTAALGALRVPTLVIASRHDAGSPMSAFPAITQWQSIAALYPDVPLTVKVLDSTRHYVSVDAPKEFDTTIAAFLRSHNAVR